jgi:hypothetical protein
MRKETIMLRIPFRSLGWAACAAAAMAFASLPIAQAAEPPPQTTADGLQLAKSSKTRLVYLKPGATFSQYDRVAILDCYVEFEKDWQKDYNSSRVGLEGRVTDKAAADRIQEDWADELCKRLDTVKGKAEQ